MQQKLEHLHIRASEQDKAMLARAAQAENMSVSQFILRTAVPIAEEIVKNAEHIQTLFRLDPDAWTEFSRLLDAPARQLPALKKLLHTKAPWES